MFLKNLLFSIILISGFFLTAELVLALAGVRPLLLSEDPLVGFADTVPQFIKANRADGAEMYITAQNKLELFNFQEFPQQKGERSYRIFCIGGSTTYGRPYQDKLSFCGWLRAYLAAADPSRDWEVINAGGISYASYRVAKIMNELNHYQPDLFIVYSGQNEFLEHRSYGALQALPAWVINLDATLSNTRTYSAMKRAIDAVQPGSADLSLKRDQLAVEVDDILNHTMGPRSYHRDNLLKQQIIMHYRMNLVRMARIADSVDAGIIYVKPAINIKDMSPFKSEHSNDLNVDALMRWQALYSDARELQQAGRLDEAMVKFRQALAIDDQYAELHFRLGQVLFGQRRYDEAESAFRRAVEEDVAPLRILPSMQQVVAEVAVAEEAPLIDFPAIIRQAYRDEYDHTIFGSEYFADHVHTNFEGYRKLGKALFDQLVELDIVRPDARWSAARTEAVRQEIIAGIDSEDEGLTFLNLGAVFEWAGKFEEARRVLLRALDILGPNEDIYTRLASSSYSIGKRDDAYDYLEKTRALAPDIPGINSKLAMIRLEQGRTDEAIEYCEIEMKNDPVSHLPHVCLALSQIEQGEPGKAKAHLDRALELRPDSGYVRLTYANYMIERQRYDEALIHGREALRINPVDYEAHNAVGSILLAQGDLEQARYHITQALRLSPDHEAARKNLERLQTGIANSNDKKSRSREL
ncbi:MAG: tetratricopeptide repeat protein [Thiotrichales bacterium]|nr:MAG: tetratricopeptide repeat protein [Thiotrichales bacterium]